MYSVSVSLSLSLWRFPISPNNLSRSSSRAAHLHFPRAAFGNDQPRRPGHERYELWDGCGVIIFDVTAVNGATTAGWGSESTLLPPLLRLLVVRAFHNRLHQGQVVQRAQLGRQRADNRRRPRGVGGEERFSRGRHHRHRYISTLR